MTSQNTPISTTVVTTMRIWMLERFTAKPSSLKIWYPPVTTGGSGLTRAPWATWMKFCKMMDMPMAVMRGASRNDSRSGR